jgi:hypothetical protein
MAALRYLSILAATYFILTLVSLALFGGPNWGTCFGLLLFGEFARVFTIWFNFVLRDK